MADYLVNLCKDHPLLELVEDPFAENDNNGYRIFKSALSEHCP
jgi:enolase